MLVSVLSWTGCRMAAAVAVMLSMMNGPLPDEPAAKAEAPAAKAEEKPAAPPAAEASAPDMTATPKEPDPTGANYTKAVTTGQLTKDGDKITQGTLSQDVKLLKISINVLWTLIAGFLVMFMQAGFALVETGLTRYKNVGHTMAMNFVVYAVGMIGFWICGFAFGFGNYGGIAYYDGPPILTQAYSFELFGKPFEILGLKGFFLSGSANDASVLTLFLFQMVFMDTAATIPTGAMAERWKFSAFVVFGFFLSMVIYPVFACWVWGGGWLADLGANFGIGNGHLDFAGSSVVHMTGGVTALAGAIILGPAHRQVQQGRLGQRDPGAQHPDGRARHADPGLRLVRLQRRQHPGRDRPAARRASPSIRCSLRPPAALRRCSTCGSSSASPIRRWPATACSPAWSRSPPRAPSSTRSAP